jgi:hypothetical protein
MGRKRIGACYMKVAYKQAFKELHAYTHIRTHTNIRTNTDMCQYINTSNNFTHIYTYMLTCTSTHNCTNTHTHILTYTQTHTHLVCSNKRESVAAEGVSGVNRGGLPHTGANSSWASTNTRPLCVPGTTSCVCVCVCVCV